MPGRRLVSRVSLLASRDPGAKHLDLRHFLSSTRCITPISSATCTWMRPRQTWQTCAAARPATQLQLTPAQMSCTPSLQTSCMHQRGGHVYSPARAIKIAKMLRVWGMSSGSGHLRSLPTAFSPRYRPIPNPSIHPPAAVIEDPCAGRQHPPGRSPIFAKERFALRRVSALVV